MSLKKSKHSQFIQIKEIVHLDGLKLSIYFSDGSNQIIDFKSFLSGSAHPQIRKYLQPKNFKEYKLIDGELMWGDFDLIFPIRDLYENQIDRG